MKTELQILNDHYDQSRANYLSGVGCDVPGESHFEFYREKHPEKYKRLFDHYKKEKS